MKKTNSTADAARYVKIRHLMLDAGVRHGDLARRLQVSPGTITLVAKGLRVSGRVRRAIARACKCRMEELWS